jgi:RimJ/RimL family protein N-acetyltransferase
MKRKRDPMVQVLIARVDWLEALSVGDDVFTARFGIAVARGWVGFPEALPHALEGARQAPDSRWGTHLFFDESDGALVGFGGFKGAPRNGEVELGYAVAPSRQGRGIATAVVGVLVERACVAGVSLVSAHTLAEESASTAVLRNNRFTRTAALHDVDTGAIWRWERIPTATGSASLAADLSEGGPAPARR